MSRARRGPVEAFFGSPEIRGAVTRFVTDSVVPNTVAFLRDAYRGYRFPKCLAAPVNIQTYGCMSPGVGACQQCRQPFCANHGLLFLSGVFDEQRLLAMLDKPTIGLCTSCVNQAFSLASQNVQAAAQAHAQAPYPPPPPPAPEPEPYMPPPGAGGPQDVPPAPGTAPGPQKARRGAVPVDAVPPRVRQAYAVLGLEPGATVAEARKAQRQLAIKYHPDKGGDVREMQAVNDAVSVIEKFHASRSKEGARVC